MTITSAKKPRRSQEDLKRAGVLLGASIERNEKVKMQRK